MTSQQAYDAAYYAANRDAILAYQRDYRDAHREELRIVAAAWRAAHPGADAAASATYDATHRASRISYRAAHRKEACARARAWRSAHAVERRAHGHAHRARVRGNGGSYTAAEWNLLLAQYDYCCAYCGKGDSALEAEHRTPLSRGGANDIENILPACGPCNRSKHTKTEAEYRGTLGDPLRPGGAA